MQETSFLPISMNAVTVDGLYSEMNFLNVGIGFRFKLSFLFRLFIGFGRFKKITQISILCRHAGILLVHALEKVFVEPFVWLYDIDTTEYGYEYMKRCSKHQVGFLTI